MYPNKNQSCVNFTVTREHWGRYPVPKTVNYIYGLGSIIGILLVFQVVTGFFLSFYYVCNADQAAISIEYIMNEVSNGWFFRNCHQKTPSLIFGALYFHIARGIYYRAYKWPNTYVWWSGIGLYILMVVVAFTGYVLPWNQVGFWAATVITSLVSAVPYYGLELSMWLWGDFSPAESLLMRLGAVHFGAPFLIISLFSGHISLLHQAAGSSDTLFEVKGVERIPLYPYFLRKDLNLLCYFGAALITMVAFTPTSLNEIEMYSLADPLTGVYVIPEWYFLPLFGMLKSIRNKRLGVFLLILFFISLLLLPVFSSKVDGYSSRDQKLHEILSVSIFTSFICLGFIAAAPLTEFAFLITKIATLWFFTSLALCALSEIGVAGRKVEAKHKWNKTNNG